MPRRALERGPLYARNRFGPARAKGEGEPQQHLPDRPDKNDPAVIAAFLARVATMTTADIAAIPCDSIPNISSADIDRLPEPQGTALRRHIFNDCAAPPIGDPFINPIGLFDAAAAALFGGKLSGVAAVVGNAVLAAAGGGLLWLGLRRIFVSGG